MIITEIFNLKPDAILLSLSPGQRLQAIRWLNAGFLEEDEFMMICGVMLAALVMLLVIVTLLGTIKRKRNSNRLFVEYADKRGLSIRERQILMEIAVKARLRLAESIFTMSDVFDRGATHFIRVTLAKSGSKRSRYLSAELSMLREKLGFRKRNAVSDLSVKTGKPSSRQIPDGRKLYLTNPEAIEYFEIETVITENTALELNVQLTQPVNCEPGDSFCARYYFGSLIWEFDTYVLRLQDNILVLQHSDNIRYVNRRRFLRVDVNEPAYIAAFPFARDLLENENAFNKGRNTGQMSDVRNIWEPPKFIPADLIELAGPGLKLISPIEVKVGDRVAVILKVSPKTLNDSGISDFTQGNISEHSRIIEDIGIVKHTKKVEKGSSIAVELTGLSDTNVSEMVRVTNEVSVSRNRIKDIQIPKKEKSEKWEVISETVAG